MKKITLLTITLLGINSISNAQVASTSFEEVAAPGGQYTDTGDPNTAHDLINNAGEPEVDFITSGLEIGFDANYSPYDTPGVGLIDGDFVGVTDFTGDVTNYTDGTKGYQLSDIDGNMILEFDPVDFNGFSNNAVFIDYYINETGWEGDGTMNNDANDRIRIYVRDLTNTAEIDILNSEGSDIDDLGIEGAWNTGTVSVPDNTLIQLVVEFRSNSGNEAIYLDNVRFEADPVILANVGFDEAFVSVSENATSVEISVAPAQAPTVQGTVEVTIHPGGTAIEGTHFNYGITQTLTFPIGQTGSQSFTIPITNNNNDDGDLFFVLQLENGSDVEIGENNLHSVYILDDDTVVPAGNEGVLDISLLNSYLVDADGTAEIAAFDPESQLLFVTNDEKMEVLDFSDPANPLSIATVNMSDFGGESVQSVAVANGIVALAVGVAPSTDPGLVLLANAVDGSGAIGLEVGALPDMITFSPDGNLLLVANEGEPNDDYSIDPEGTISVIDVSGGLGAIDQSNVTTLTFNNFDAQQQELMDAGVRIYGPGASVSRDLEPEYIAVSNDSEKAYVVLQENNAYAVVDLLGMDITDVISFGLKDHSLPGNTLDLSDEIDFVFDANWPVKGMYMPDAISFYEANGTGYIVTANEGDAREYDTYEEERKIDDDDYVLDALVFSNIDILELESNLAEINVTNASGDIDNDGEFEEIHVFGGRSFSIFEAETGTLVYDSGNDFEVITANDPIYGPIFNASNSNNNYKNRSDNKGPEPEGITVQTIGDQTYAFILLERIGGVMVYDITNPATSQFLAYLNNRDATLGGDEMGDLGPEGIVYIAPSDSPTGKGLLVISNEVSATISVYELGNDILGNDEFSNTFNNGFAIFPNPANQLINFSIAGNYTIYDLSGRLILKVIDSSSVFLEGIAAGTYLIQNEKGQTKKLIVR